MREKRIRRQRCLAVMDGEEVIRNESSGVPSPAKHMWVMVAASLSRTPTSLSRTMSQVSPTAEQKALEVFRQSITNAGLYFQSTDGTASHDEPTLLCARFRSKMPGNALICLADDSCELDLWIPTAHLSSSQRQKRGERSSM